MNEELMDLYGVSKTTNSEAFKLTDSTLRALQMIQLILIDSDQGDDMPEIDAKAKGIDGKIIEQMENFDLSEKSIKNIEKIINDAKDHIPAIRSILEKTGQLKTRGILNVAGAGVGAVGKGVGFVGGGALKLTGTVVKGAGTAVGAVFNFMTEFAKTLILRRDAIIEFIGNAVERYEKNGLIGLAEMLKPSIKALIDSNESLKNAAEAFKDKLDLAEDGITVLNQLTGGRYRPINAISVAVKGLDRVANILRDTERPDDKNILVARLAGILVRTKDVRIQRVQRVLSQVCTSLEDSKQYQKP